MKKVLPLLTATVLFTVTLAGMGLFLDGTAAQKQEALLYCNTDERNFCAEAMGTVFAREGTVPVFGSSELSASDNIAYPPFLFQNGNSDFNMIMIGRGNMQSLHHAINMGALAEEIPGRKAVLIVSPQWFTAEGVSPSAYSSRFSEEMYARFIRNSRLSPELRAAVSSRVQSLLSGDPHQLERAQRRDALFLQYSLNPVERLGQAIYDGFLEEKAAFALFWPVRDRNVSFDAEPIRTEFIDFDALREQALRAGEEACTNNEFGIYDSYYEEYIAENLESMRDSYQESDGYSVSLEYDDLILFIRTCQETGIEPLIVSVPVNGRWYDWLGFPKEERETYYQNIRDICSSYNVQIADFSDREYELYFLKDTMHMGWKGWVDLDEAVYRFYQGK